MGPIRFAVLRASGQVQTALPWTDLFSRYVCSDYFFQHKQHSIIVFVAQLVPTVV